MKKTILCSFLTVLTLSYSEDSSAFSSAFGLDSTTMRANDILQSSATSSSSALGSRKDAYRQLYAKSVFALRIPGGAMQQFFNTYRTHFTPGSNPVTGSFGQMCTSLLNQDEFEMIFADSELDNNFATATSSLKDQIDNLVNLYNELNKWLYTLGGIEEDLRKPKELQTQQIKDLKSTLDALGINVSEYTGLLELREVLKDQNNYFSCNGADTDIDTVIQEVNSLTDQIDRIEQEYKMLAEVLKLNVAEFSDNSLELETKFNKTWKKIGGSINKLRESLPIYNAKKNIGTQLIKNIGSIVSTDSTANSALLQNLVVFQQNDPRLDYILKYDLDKFNFTEAQDTVTKDIFAQLRDRQLRNEFREKSGFSWKDMQDLMMHELFVARNRGNLLLQQFLSSVISDMYDTPEFWVPATEEEVKYANEDAKRLAFLMAEGAIFKINPNFQSVNNNATQTLQTYVNAINRLTEGSLQDVDHAALNNSLIPLFLTEKDELDNTIDRLLTVSTHETGKMVTSDASTVEAERLRLQRMERIREMSGLYRNHTFDPSIFNIYDCGSIQIKDVKSVSLSCCLNSFLNIYCNGNWNDGVFYLNRLANYRILRPYFSNLRKIIEDDRESLEGLKKSLTDDKKQISVYGKLLTDEEKENLIASFEASLNDKEVWYKKVVDLKSCDLSHDHVTRVLGLVFGTDLFINNTQIQIQEYMKRTIFGPTLAISGYPGHFQGLRLYKTLDTTKGQPYTSRLVRNFKMTDPTYIEVMEKGTTDLRAFIQSKGDGDSEKDKDEQPKMKQLTSAEIDTLSPEAQFAYNIFGWSGYLNPTFLLDKGLPPLKPLDKSTSSASFLTQQQNSERERTAEVSPSTRSISPHSLMRPKSSSQSSVIHAEPDNFGDFPEDSGPEPPFSLMGPRSSSQGSVIHEGPDNFGDSSKNYDEDGALAEAIARSLIEQ